MSEPNNIPLHPPVEWFSPPEDIPTDRRLTITADGRVYGYIALWDQCHAGASGCVRPPKGSPTGYEYAHQGFTLSASGEELRTAVIAGGTVHAPNNATSLQVPEHYENTGKQMMRVRYGEDNNGIWFAGALWPDLDDVLIEKLRASSISGDWRFSAGWRNAQGGEYDFAGACLVNLPGFPTPTDENSVYMRAGQAYSLVASATHVDVGIIMVDDTYTAFDEDYPCDESLQAAGGATETKNTSGEDMSDDTTEENIDASADEETPQPAEETPATDGNLDSGMAMNMKLDEVITRLGALETMISQAEAERLLKQVMQGDEE
jgi:hypothetical protein